MKIVHQKGSNTRKIYIKIFAKEKLNEFRLNHD